MHATVEIGNLIERRLGLRGCRPVVAGTGVSIQRIAGWYKLGLDARGDRGELRPSLAGPSAHRPRLLPREPPSDRWLPRRGRRRGPETGIHRAGALRSLADRVSLRLFLDEDATFRSLIRALVARGLDVTNAIDAGRAGLSDAEQLEHAD